MARIGWQAVATDIEPVLSSVLRPNVEAGAYQLYNAAQIPTREHIIVRELDWNAASDRWSWDRLGASSASVSDSSRASEPPHDSGASAMPRFDLILTADTIYEPSLVEPLFSTLAALYYGQRDHPEAAPRPACPTLLLALERRDSQHIDDALHLASHRFDLPFKQIPARKIRKTFDAFGDGLTWPRDDSSGVEIWKL
jgi:hypothetical protein